ncbi:TIGR03086 family metal-binding protein [Gryllotalpicola ginsengisoli]|uniref:TIGR03086 family metal-binding protein n=1 Tax=Gryllotalpicola ginsengisoli TaxID=444608 RepID=UPI0003B6A689|nr:TIGR03086 family metal-binding protein [Gryllotalpicola ginsengisoli]
MSDTPDWRALQTLAHRTFADRLARVTDWTAPTPDTEWNVRQLVSHVIEEQQWVPPLLAGRTIAEARSRIEPLRADLVAEWARYSARAAEAWAAADLDAVVQLSYDAVPARQYLAEQVCDVTVHTWDLARAIGADEQLPGELVEAAWSVLEPQQDTLQASGLYAPAVPVPEDAPLQTRLLALTGRRIAVAAAEPPQ